MLLCGIPAAQVPPTSVGFKPIHESCIPPIVRCCTIVCFCFLLSGSENHTLFVTDLVHVVLLSFPHLIIRDVMELQFPCFSSCYAWRMRSLLQLWWWVRTAARPLPSTREGRMNWGSGIKYSPSLNTENTGESISVIWSLGDEESWIHGPAVVMGNSVQRSSKLAFPCESVTVNWMNAVDVVTRKFREICEWDERWMGQRTCCSLEHRAVKKRAFRPSIKKENLVRASKDETVRFMFTATVALTHRPLFHIVVKIDFWLSPGSGKDANWVNF